MSSLPRARNLAKQQRTSGTYGDQRSVTVPHTWSLRRSATGAVPDLWQHSPNARAPVRVSGSGAFRPSYRRRPRPRARTAPGNLVKQGNEVELGGAWGCEADLAAGASGGVEQTWAPSIRTGRVATPDEAAERVWRLWNRSSAQRAASATAGRSSGSAVVRLISLSTMLVSRRSTPGMAASWLARMCSRCR